MSDSIGVGAQEISQDLENRLGAARKEKSLAQVPALRRLRITVRTLLVLGLVSSILTLGLGFALWAIRALVVARDLGPSTHMAFALYVLVLWLSQGLSWLGIYAELRLLRQFKRNHLADLKESANVLVRLLAYGLLLGVAALPIAVVMYQRTEEVVASIVGSLGGLAIGLVMYLFIRHYVRAAEADLDALRIAAGGEGPRGAYPSWRSAFLVCLALTLIVLGAGYALAGG